MARIVQIYVGLPQTVGTPDAALPMAREWRSSFFKEPVNGLVHVSKTNIEGDRQADLKNHGGIEKAILAYSLHHYSSWPSIVGTTLPYGAFGENLLMEGQDEASVCIGDIFRMGTVLAQVSQPRQPCWKLSRRWRLKELSSKTQEMGWTGWYLRVLEEGEIQAGNEAVLEERPFPEWSVARANTIMHGRPANLKLAQDLASCAALSDNWKKTLKERVATGKAADSKARLVGPNT